MAHLLRFLVAGLLAAPLLAQDGETVDAVGEATAALQTADAAEFAKLAALDEPDPWLVADRLLRDGQPERALRFATSKPRPGVQGLADYLRTNPAPSGAVAEAIALAQLRLEDDRATQEQLAGAIAALRSSVDGASPMEDARIHSLLGLAHAYAGDIAASSRALERAAATAERVGWLREAADALGTASENARVLLRYEDAVLIARRELVLRNRLADEPGVLAHLQRLAQLLDENGDLPAAAQELDGWSGKLSARANTELAISRANLRLQQADLTEALAVLRADAKAQDADQRGRVAMLAGDIQRQQGAEREALESYRAAALCFEESKDGILSGRAIGNAGVSLVRLGLPQEAHALLDRAQTQFDAAGDRSLVALAVLFRGDARFAAGERGLALRLYNSVRDFASSTGDGWLEANALRRRGRTLLANGDVEDARRAYSACHELGKRVRAPELAAAGAVGEARCLLREKHVARAAEALDRAANALAPLIEGQAVPPGDEAHEIFADLAAARVETALLEGSPTNLWRALEHQRLGVPVRSAEHARLLRESAMTPALQAEETAARQQIQRATLFEDRAREEEDLAIAVQWKSRREQAERDLAGVVDSVQLASRPGWEALFPVPAPLANVRERLTPTEVLVAFALTDERAAALVVSRAEVRLVQLGSAGGILSAQGVDRRRLLLDVLGLRDSQSRVLVVLPPEMRDIPLGALDPNRSFIRVPSGTEFDRLRGRRYAAGEGTKTEWRGSDRVRVYVGPAPELGAIEASSCAADLAILTEPIETAALPRAFFLRGTTAVAAPLVAVDAATVESFRAAMLKAWEADPAHDAAAAVRASGAGNWIVWGR